MRAARGAAPTNHAPAGSDRLAVLEENEPSVPPQASGSASLFSLGQPGPGLDMEHTDSWTPGSTTSLHQLLRRDMAGSVCSACTENKEACEAWHATLRLREEEADTSSRHCVPCGSCHPPAFFSRIKQCIGRRGYVRLCEHPNCVIT